MKSNAKNDWMFEEFKMYCPFSRHAVFWSLFDSTQILVELDDGNKVLYDCMQQTYRFIYPWDLDEDNEERWRYEFSQRLQTKMRQLGLDQNDIAIRTGISQPMFSRYMTGKSIPNIYNTEKIAKVLRCSIDELIRFPY